MQYIKLKYLSLIHIFRVCDHIGTVHLHQIRFEPEAGLTGTGAANHQHIVVSGGLWVLGAAVHCQALRFRQNHIVLEYRVDVCLLYTSTGLNMKIGGIVN